LGECGSEASAVHAVFQQTYKGHDVKPHNGHVPEFCAERARLLIEYSEATSNLRPLSSALSEGALSYELDAFLSAWKRLKTATERCARLHQALASHVKAHHCGFGK